MFTPAMAWPYTEVRVWRVLTIHFSSLLHFHRQKRSMHTAGRQSMLCFRYLTWMTGEAGSWSVCSLIWTQHLICAAHQTGVLLCTAPYSHWNLYILSNQHTSVPHSSWQSWIRENQAAKIVSLTMRVIAFVFTQLTQEEERNKKISTGLSVCHRF